MQTNLSNFGNRKKATAKKTAARKTARKAPAKKTETKKKPLKQSYDREKGEKSPKLTAKQRSGIGSPIIYDSRTVHKGVEIKSRTQKHTGYTEVDQRYTFDRSAPVKKAPAPVKKPSSASADARKAIDDISKENAMIRKALKQNAEVIKLARDKGWTNKARMLEKAQEDLEWALKHDKNLPKVREQRRIDMKGARDWMQKAKGVRD